LDVQTGGIEEGQNQAAPKVWGAGKNRAAYVGELNRNVKDLNTCLVGVSEVLGPGVESVDSNSA